MHFDRALERYKSGQYREAIGELNQALKYDPRGKDLVYNRALVYEKLGEIDRAIEEYHHYLRMETDPKLRAQARATIHRLRGARREVEAPEADAGPPAPAAPQPAPAAPQPARAGAHEKSRLDGWVIATGGVAAAALLIGTIFGVGALATEPGSGDSTGPSTSASDLQSKAEQAHSFAVVADVSFVIALLSGGTAGALYFLRSPAPPSESARRGPRALPSEPGTTAFSVGVHF